MIRPEDFPSLPNSVALRVLAKAVTICPCLHGLESEGRATAIAILASVGETLVGPRPPGHIKRETIGPSTYEYTSGQIGSAFTPDDRDSLRALCKSVSAAGPVGSFPRHPRVLRHLFPEDE